MAKIMKLQNHPEYNPLFDSHPQTANIYDRGRYKTYRFDLRIDNLNALYKKIGFPFHVTYKEFPAGWRGKLYQLEFVRTEPITDELKEMNYYMPQGLQALDKIDIVRYIEHMHYYAVYLHNFLNDKYKESQKSISLQGSQTQGSQKDDMPF